jgi:hypothetical protein
VDGLAAAFPLLDEFGRQLRSSGASEDTERETDRQVLTWNNLLQTNANAVNPGMDRTLYEQTVKVGVRTQLLESWLGERLVKRCIHVDPQGLVMMQVQQIVDSLIPDVPVEREIIVETPTAAAATQAPPPAPPNPVGAEKTAIQIELQVVDRDAFALELAREWVLSGLPRNPVR